MRLAVADDAELIAQHRHQMFLDNCFAATKVLAQMDTALSYGFGNSFSKGTNLGYFSKAEQSVLLVQECSSRLFRLIRGTLGLCGHMY